MDIRLVSWSGAGSSHDTSCHGLICAKVFLCQKLKFMKDLRLPSKLLNYPGGVAAAAPLNPTPSQWSYARKSFALISRAMQVLLFSLILLVIPYLLLRWVCQRIYLRFFHPQKARLREDSKAEDRKESAHGLLQSRFPRPEIYRDVVGMEDWGELEFASAVSTQEYTESQAWKESAHHLNVPKKRYPGLEKHLDMDQIQDWLQSERARAIRLLQRVDRFGFCSACESIASSGMLGNSHHNFDKLKESATAMWRDILQEVYGDFLRLGEPV
ncbi:hypothetical protein SCUP515_10946 [Seiridium cupressi]